MMRYEIAPKVYKIDYEFIIKNYTDKSLWTKHWTLFVYKDFVINLRLKRINTFKEEVVFELDITNNNYSLPFDNSGYTWVSNHEVRYNVKNTSISILKQQIEGAMFSIIKELEEKEIKASENYITIYNTRSIENNRLVEIAENFLDDLDITHDDVRGAYIDRFVDANSEIDSKLQDYVNNMRFRVYSEIFLVFCEITKQEDRKNAVLQSIDSDEAEKIMAKVEEVIAKMETNEYDEEKQANLEDL